MARWMGDPSCQESQLQNPFLKAAASGSFGSLSAAGGSLHAAQRQSTGSCSHFATDSGGVTGSGQIGSLSLAWCHPYGWAEPDLGAEAIALSVTAHISKGAGAAASLQEGSGQACGALPRTNGLLVSQKHSHEGSKVFDGGMCAMRERVCACAT